MENKVGGAHHINSYILKITSSFVILVLAIIFQLTFVTTAFASYPLNVMPSNWTIINSYTPVIQGGYTNGRYTLGIACDGSGHYYSATAENWGGEYLYTNLSVNGNSYIGATSTNSWYYANTPVTPGASMYVSGQSSSYGTINGGSWTWGGTGYVLPAPSIPSGLSVTGNGNSATLNWTANNSSDQVTNYKIYDNSSLLTTVGNITTYSINNLAWGSSHSYKISAVNTTGESLLSSPVVYYVPSLPSIPNGLSASDLTNTSFTTYWLSQSDATSYNVYLDGTLQGNVSQPQTNNPSYNFINLQSSSTHTVTVIAVNQWGLSEQSQPLTVTLLPSLPNGLQASNITSTSLNLSWSSVNGANSYAVYENGSQIGTSGVASYSMTGLTPITAYSFQVAAINSAGQSQLSNTVNITTLGIPPVIPSDLSAGNITSSSFTLYWIKQSDATNYNVYMDGTLVENVLQPLFYNPSLDISNLTEGSTHSMTVTAVNQWGESAASLPLIVTTTISNPVLKANVDNSNIKLSWTGVGTSFDIIVDGNPVDHVSNSPYNLSKKPGTYQIQIIQNYNGQQYPSNILTVTISALQNVGAVKMTSDLLSNTGAVIAPAGGLLALALALKGSPMLIAAVKAFFLKR